METARLYSLGTVASWRARTLHFSQERSTTACRAVRLLVERVCEQRPGWADKTAILYSQGPGSPVPFQDITYICTHARTHAHPFCTSTGGPSGHTAYGQTAKAKQSQDPESELAAHKMREEWGN